jgi:hypothetical protein
MNRAGSHVGSIERTSFAEAPEVKGFVVLQLTQSGLGSYEPDRCLRGEW